MDLSNWLAFAGIAVAIGLAYANDRAKAKQTAASERQALDRYIGEFDALADQLAFVWRNLAHQDDLDFIASASTPLTDIDWNRFSLDELALSGFPIKRQKLLSDAVVHLNAEIRRWNGEIKSRGHVAKQHGVFNTRLYGMKVMFKPVASAAKRVFVLLGKAAGDRHAGGRRKCAEKLATIDLTGY